MIWRLLKLLRRSKSVVIDRSTENGQSLTSYELDFTVRGRCPDCDGDLLVGPQGGCSVNVRCDRCGSKFNVVPGLRMGERISDPSPDPRTAQDLAREALSLRTEVG